jgi:hypothetical protein
MTSAEVVGAVVATLVAIALRYAAYRWPLPSDKRKPREGEE